MLNINSDARGTGGDSEKRSKSRLNFKVESTGFSVRVDVGHERQREVMNGS